MNAVERFAAGFLLIAMATSVLWIPLVSVAHLERAPSAQAPVTCYSLAARAAWGASAQLRGAPPEFKEVSYERLRAMFFGPDAAVPVDGIYMLADLGIDERDRYQRHALAGYWWARNNPIAKVDREFLIALFIEHLCKDGAPNNPVSH